MKNLARHIELLLRDNDCVILPGFGGFIAHDVPAYYVGEEGLYYPPTRSISFNAAISMNDGLLAQSYMKSYHVDYARANYMIDMTIEQLTDMLDEEGSVTLSRIGTITQDAYHSLQFTPDVAGIASPMHFGLGAFSIKELSQLNKPVETLQKAEATQRAKTISIHINKEMLHRMISTAAIILLLLMVALPTGHHRPTDIASLHLTELITATPMLQPETAPATVVEEAITETCDTLVQPTALFSTIEMEEEIPTTDAESTETVIEEVSVPAEVIVPAADTPQPVSVAAQSTKTYHIIVASLPNHRGADETLAQYLSQGYAEASLVERDGRVRISLIQFANKDEANEYLEDLRQNEKFQSAWLLAVRN